MKILLTGANGFLGKFIVEELGKSNTLFCLSRTSGDYKVSLENEIPKFYSDFEIVIHAAGKAHSLPKNDFERKQFYDVNVIGTINLLKGLEKAHLPKQFVFISSVSVYGQKTGVNINENQALQAKDSYGLSKIKAEKIVFDWCEKNNVICTILRLPLLVGKNPPGNLGAIIKAIDKGFYFNIAGGKARKSMVLAKDVALFIPIVSPKGGIYNLTDDFHPSFNELSLALSNKKRNFFSLPLFLAKILGKIGDHLGDRSPINSLKVIKITSDLTFDNSKVKQFFDWEPESVLNYIKRVNIK